MQVDRTRMYRVSAVAELLDVSKSSVYRATEAGDLDALRIGSAVRIPGTALAAWLEQCAQAAYEHHVVAGESAADLDAAENAEVAAR
jgi:excisionase family DNA binding protein